MSGQRYFVYDPASGDDVSYDNLTDALEDANIRLSDYRGNAMFDGEWLLDVKDLSVLRAPVGSEWHDLVEIGEKIAEIKGIEFPPEEDGEPSSWDYALELTETGRALVAARTEGRQP